MRGKQREYKRAQENFWREMDIFIILIMVVIHFTYVPLIACNYTSIKLLKHIEHIVYKFIYKQKVMSSRKEKQR